MAKEYILGFPVNRVVPLTSYEDAVTILTQLGEKGADQLLVDYQYWNKDGTGSAIQTDLKPEGRLGGAKSSNPSRPTARRRGSDFISASTSTTFIKAAGVSTKIGCGLVHPEEPGHAVYL